jgi:hypothetical protein
MAELRSFARWLELSALCLVQVRTQHTATSTSMSRLEGFQEYSKGSQHLPLILNDVKQKKLENRLIKPIPAFFNA